MEGDLELFGNGVFRANRWDQNGDWALKEALGLDSQNNVYGLTRYKELRSYR